jgi:predicted MFS family arabinose efflux permease
VTAGLLVTVYGLIGTDHHGWTSARTLGLLAGGVALLVAFVIVESRSKAPLVPLGLLRDRAVATGNLGQLINGAGFVGSFFALSLFLQTVMHMSAIEAGLAFVPMGVTAIAGATIAPAAVTRFGTRATFALGAALAAAGVAWLTQVDASTSYAAGILPAALVYGLAIPFIGVPNTITAVSGVPAARAGTASGLVNASFQVGGAVGVAIVTTLATTRTADGLAAGASPADALAAGYARGFVAAAIILALGVVLALVASPRLRPSDADTELALAAA